MNFDLKGYQKNAIKTAMYNAVIKFQYLLLGMAEELTELYEKIIQYAQNDVEVELLQKEFGDIMWYFACWAEENGLELHDIFRNSLGEVRTKIENIDELMYELVIGIKVISGNGKKALRDEFDVIQAGTFPERKKANINEAVGSLISTLIDLASYYNFDIQELLDMNIEKLQSRQKRGKIGGSGDAR